MWMEGRARIPRPLTYSLECATDNWANMRGSPLYFLSFESWTNFGSSPLQALHHGAKNFTIRILSGYFSRNALCVLLWLC